MKGVSKEFFNKLILITLAGLTIWNFERVLGILSIIQTAVTPLFIGVIFAVILNVPMQFFEKEVYKKLKKRKSMFALWTSVIIFAGFLTGFGFMVFPKLIESIKTVVENFQSGNTFESLSSDNQFFSFVFENLKKLTESFIDRLQDYLPKMLQVAENVLRVVLNVFLGLFFAILILSNKEELSKQFKKLIYYITKREKIKDVLDLFRLAVNKFSKYIGGQLIEAILLGSVCYILMVIIGLPFAALISAIIALVNLIPMVGGYVGGSVATLLIFSVNPEQALIFVIFIVILQQLEAVTTYPVIVGKHVGLSGFWILTSVVLGGGLFGFMGVLLSVPVMAFLHDFVGGLVAKKEMRTSLLLDGSKHNVIK